VHKLILVLSVFTVSAAMAKETWFGITGINNRNSAMNYSSFYDESNAFLQACKKNPNRDCRRYINPNLALAQDSGGPNAPQIIGENRGTPAHHRRTGNGILRSIEAAIANAQRGDRILISLNNHGGPGRDREGQQTSCIFIQSGQKICDSDLARIIGDLPQRRGFQVAIVAEGCFSGGFNSLASKNVCVATTSDQQRAAYGTRFWQSVNESSPATLADAGRTYNNGGNPYDRTMLASQYIENLGCQATNSAMQTGNLIPDILANSPIRFNETQLCTSNSGYRQLNELSYAMNSITNQLSNSNTTQRICAVSTEWCTTINNVIRNQTAFTETQEYAATMAEIRNLQARIDARIGEAYAGLNANEVHAISMFINYGNNSFIDALPSDRQGHLRRIANSYSAYAASNSAEVNRLFARASELVRQWQNSPIASDDLPPSTGGVKSSCC
jgi:hypothetical protein